MHPMSFPVHLGECTNCIEFWWRLKIPAVGIDNLITDIVSERLDLKRVGHIVNSWNIRSFWILATRYFFGIVENVKQAAANFR